MADDNKKDGGCAEASSPPRVPRRPSRRTRRRRSKASVHADSAPPRARRARGSGETHRRRPFRGCASRKESEPRGFVVRVGGARQPPAYARELSRGALRAAALPEKRPYVSAATHASMQGNKSKDTKPELLVRERLREAGLGGYRLQWKAPGRPGCGVARQEGVLAHQWLLLAPVPEVQPSRAEEEPRILGAEIPAQRGTRPAKSRFAARAGVARARDLGVRAEKRRPSMRRSSRLSPFFARN